jgi:hypothetical protein
MGKSAGTTGAQASRAFRCPGYPGPLNSWQHTRRQPKGRRSAPADQRSFPGRSMRWWPASTGLPSGRGWGSPRRQPIAESSNASGDKRVAKMERQHVQKIIGAKAETPAAANNLLRMVHLLMQHAIDLEWRRDGPTGGVRKIKNKTEGFATWEEDHIDRFLAHHQPGTRAHLAFCLLLYTGQRRSDVVRMGRQHWRRGWDSNPR